MNADDVARDLQAVKRARWCESQTLDDKARVEADATLQKEISRIADFHRQTIADLLELVPDDVVHQVLQNVRPFLLTAIPQRHVHPPGQQPPINDPHRTVPLMASAAELRQIDPATYDQRTGLKVNEARLAHAAKVKADADARRELADLKRNFPRAFGASR